MGERGGIVKVKDVVGDVGMKSKLGNKQRSGCSYDRALPSAPIQYGTSNTTKDY